ncbi:MAG: SUMF1/EgtB/PvdO family nonheme iron enzyme [Chloroflexota bacterium]|jgi:formylglycine-generating enzyme required for sulfatase activity
MFDVFLSHNSADKSAVELIAHRLRTEAGLNPFLDKWHLVPGVSWQQALEDALQDSATVAVFIGPSGVSPWHNEEMRAALDRAVRTRDEYRVIPVLLPEADPGTVKGFLARRTWVDFRTGLDDGEAFERLVSGIKGEAIVSGTYELPDEPAPYRGLLHFDAEHARFFFGRTADTRRLINKLEQHIFVAVVGASGSGKSSLVRAGLLPALAENIIPGSRTWGTLICTPGSQPLRAVAEQLATLVPTADRLRTADELTVRLAGQADGLRTSLTTLLAERGQPALLIVDQFEELFTKSPNDSMDNRDQVEQFIVNLADTASHGDGRIRILIALRADFLDRGLAFPALRDLLQDRHVLLGALNKEALREAIVRPAQEVGAFFEKGLVNTILRDVSSELGAMPLLQHALYELWRQRRGPWLTLEAYEATGGVQGALNQRAQKTYEALSVEQKAIARNILLRLTTLGEGVNDTRRRAARAELYPVGVDPTQVDIVIQSLSGMQARLVIANEKTVEVSHEALIQGWDTLRDWLEEDRESLRVQHHLTKSAEDWDRRGRDPGELYRGKRLAQAENWAKDHAEVMSPLEEAFLKASQQAMARERRAVRMRWIGIGATVIVALVMVALGVTGRLNRFIYRPLSMDWVEIPAGEFQMGTRDEDINFILERCSDCQRERFADEQPVHTVYLDAYEIGLYEVTNKQYAQCVRAGICREPESSRYTELEYEEHPVVFVNWFDAQRYCEWHRGARLPTEAEWEKAAKGEDGRLYPWGIETPSCSLANYRTLDGGCLDDTMPVGVYPDGASYYGVMDMAGNVWEWLYDWYAQDYYTPEPVTNPQGPQDGDFRVRRGGAWNERGIHLRSASRLQQLPESAGANIGFRCARGISP